MKEEEVMLKNLTNSQIVPAALKGENAATSTGNMSTDTYSVGRPGYLRYRGSLNRVWARLLSERMQAGAISQIIYSYSTPIAWHDSEHGWIIPDESYSVTTSAKHQTHLWRIPGARRIAMPYDATPEDVRRVMLGELVFVTKGYGMNRAFIGTRPGANYAGE